MTILHKPFGELSRAEKGELLLAHHEGKRIERRGYYGTWYDVEVPRWFCDSIYRIATEPLVPDSIDWSHVAPEYNFMARDGDDGVWLYKVKPTISRDNWETVCAQDMDRMVGFASYRRGTVDWKDSLVIRPGYEGS